MKPNFLNRFIKKLTRERANRGEQRSAVNCGLPTHHCLNNLLQIRSVFRCIDRLLKSFHIGMPDFGVDSRNDLQESFRRGQAEPLNANLTCRCLSSADCLQVDSQEIHEKLLAMWAEAGLGRFPASGEAA
jgi:hypothetical protein